LRNVLGGKALPKASRADEAKEALGKLLTNLASSQCPWTEECRSLAAVEGGSQFSRRRHLRIAVQAVAELVGIFLMNARKCQSGEAFGGVEIKP
jgi:hypothetical protein